MLLYLKKGKLKYEPKDIDIPFYIYDLGTYHVAVEEDSDMDNTLKSMSPELISEADLTKNLSGKIPKVMDMMIDIGLVDCSFGMTETTSFFSLTRRLSFGPAKVTDDPVFKAIESLWRTNGLYQTAYTTVSDIAKKTGLSKEDVRRRLMTLLENGNVSAYDIEPKYDKELYNKVETMPFVIYTEGKKEIEDVVLNAFIGKEFKNVS